LPPQRSPPPRAPPPRAAAAALPRRSLRKMTRAAQTTRPPRCGQILPARSPPPRASVPAAVPGARQPARCGV